MSSSSMLASVCSGGDVESDMESTTSMMALMCCTQPLATKWRVRCNPASSSPADRLMRGSSRCCETESWVALCESAAATASSAPTLAARDTLSIVWTESLSTLPASTTLSSGLL